MKIERSGNQSFTSVVPIRVMVNGNLVPEGAYSKPAGEIVSKILRNAIKYPEKNFPLADELAKCDPDFNMNNFRNQLKNPNSNFKLPHAVRILTSGNKLYLLTGKDAAKLEDAGRRIGICKKQQNDFGKSTNAFNNLDEALKNYGYTVRSIIKDKLARLTSGFDSQKRRIGARLGLVVELDSIPSKNGKKILKYKNADFSYMMAEY